MTNQTPQLVAARSVFHVDLLTNVMRVTPGGNPNNADKDSGLSVAIARQILSRLGTAPIGKLSGQALGSKFEQVCERFLQQSFPLLEHLRPGPWSVDRHGPRNANEAKGIAQFEQYDHLVDLQRAAKVDKALAAALGTDYIIKPDVMVYRRPYPDEEINRVAHVVDASVGQKTPIRQTNQTKELLHASISCKWTIRSDRAQNSRSEGLNLIRNRKGRVPHISVITAEPLPSRIASIALGTGDLDCIYHFALPELQEAIEIHGNDDSKDMMNTMVNGKRLRDISDLPLDLVL